MIGSPRTVAATGDDQLQWRVRRLMPSSSTATSLPVSLSSAMSAGASGLTIYLCLLSWPLDVHA